MKKKGFTLTELIVALAILAVLAAVALPVYKKYLLTAKTSEAKMNIGAIITCEDSYAATENQYLTESYYPTGLPGPTPRYWNPALSGNFEVIGFEPAGKVYYSYGVAAGDVCSDPAAANPLHGQVPVTKGADITVIAKGDLDGDGLFGYFCTTDLRFPKIRGSIGDI